MKREKSFQVSTCTVLGIVHHDNRCESFSTYMVQCKSKRRREKNQFNSGKMCKIYVFPFSICIHKSNISFYIPPNILFCIFYYDHLTLFNSSNFLHVLSTVHALMDA